MKIFNGFNQFLVAVILIASFFMVGKMEAKDEYDDFVSYCINVSEGIYPDYKHIFAECKGFSYK